MTEPLQNADLSSSAPAGFVEKTPLERYVPPKKPSLIGLSRAALADALGEIGGDVALWQDPGALGRQANEIDFEDMLNLTIDHIEAGRWSSPYDLVMVDEMQDASLARSRMVNV